MKKLNLFLSFFIPALIFSIQFQTKPVFCLSKGQLESDKTSTESKILLLRIEQLMFISNQPDDPATFMQVQARFVESISKLKGFLVDLNNRLTSTTEFNSDAFENKLKFESSKSSAFEFKDNNLHQLDNRIVGSEKNCQQSIEKSTMERQCNESIKFVIDKVPDVMNIDKTSIMRHRNISCFDAVQ